MDKDFQEYAYSVFTLVEKIRQTKSGTLFHNYVNKTIDEAGKNVLFNNFGFSNEKKFVDVLMKIYSQGRLINRKFNLTGSEEQKRDIEEAARKVITIVFRPTHTVADCWLLFVSGMSACFQGCPLTYDEEMCYDYCFGLVVSSTSVCFLFAD